MKAKINIKNKYMHAIPDANPSRPSNQLIAFINPVIHITVRSKLIIIGNSISVISGKIFILNESILTPTLQI